MSTENLQTKLLIVPTKDAIDRFRMEMTKATDCNYDLNQIGSFLIDSLTAPLTDIDTNIESLIDYYVQDACESDRDLYDSVYRSLFDELVFILRDLKWNDECVFFTDSIVSVTSKIDLVDFYHWLGDDLVIQVSYRY